MRSVLLFEVIDANKLTTIFRLQERVLLIMRMHGKFIISFRLVVCFSDNLLLGSTATDQDSRLSWPEKHRDSVIRFAQEEGDESEGSEEDEDVRARGITLIQKLWSMMMT